MVLFMLLLFMVLVLGVGWLDLGLVWLWWVLEEGRKVWCFSESKLLPIYFFLDSFVTG